MDFERSLVRLSWVLPATHRKLTEVQNSSLGWLHRVLSSHPQPSRHREDENRSHGSTSARRSFLKAMPLSTAESGHPTRWGFGNSRDRPCVSRSTTRFSSLLNSSCSL